MSVYLSSFVSLSLKRKMAVIDKNDRRAKDGCAYTDAGWSVLKITAYPSPGGSTTMAWQPCVCIMGFFTPKMLKS